MINYRARESYATTRLAVHAHGQMVVVAGIHHAYYTSKEKQRDPCPLIPGTNHAYMHGV